MDRMLQNTLKRPISVEGVGLHTGKKVVLTFTPAKEHTGFVFKRVDLEGHPIVEASVLWATDTKRGTNLSKNGVDIHTSEHVLAALVGNRVHNCIIELNSPEPPIMDGSSKFFVEAIIEAGIEQQTAPIDEYIVDEIITYTDEESGSTITLMPADKYEVLTLVDYNTKVLGTQNAVLNDLSDFNTEIANARTFSFLHEIEMLLKNGLIKGGDLNNAIVYVDKPLSGETTEELKKAFNKKSVSIKPNGILDNLSLHYHNEAARHKLLDVMGDLALLGKSIRGRIIAQKPGHKVNVNFTKKLFKQVRAETKLGHPRIDLNKDPIKDVVEIMKMLPHRPPFLLVDKIYELSDNHVVGTKSVTMNESFFQGHFPGKPVMPGVLIIEAMAQAGGILVLSTVPDPENYLTFFTKIDQVKFKYTVGPGDTIVFKLDLVSPIRRGIVEMKGTAYVSNRVVAEGILMAKILRREES